MDVQGKGASLFVQKYPAPAKRSRPCGVLMKWPQRLRLPVMEHFDSPNIRAATDAGLAKMAHRVLQVKR